MYECLTKPCPASVGVVAAVGPGAHAVVDLSSPIVHSKAIKNAAELEGMREAHLRDAVAICDFLNWLESKVGASNCSGYTGCAAWKVSQACNIHMSVRVLMNKPCHNLRYAHGALLMDVRHNTPAPLCRCFRACLPTAQIASGGTLTEVEVDLELTGRRRQQQGFIEPSFPTIAGANSNGAVIHYRAQPETCK